MAKIYKVGGCVRDKLLGIDSKDIDFTFVCEDSQTVEGGWIEMTSWMRTNGFEVFLETPEMFTIRAKFPKGHQYSGMVADFVMARKEVGYIEGTRRPKLELGNLMDDLIRRDFTLNAMAEDVDGSVIDLFEGQWALENKLLITPRDARITMLDDPLRLLRCVRFSITKGFTINQSIIEVMDDFDYNEQMKKVSQERIRDELNKCFLFDSYKTLKILRRFNKLEEYIFTKTNIKLLPKISY